jgi:glycosyltransferase involved in cell wall biosynthesis
MVPNLKIRLLLDFTLVIPTLGRRQDELTEALKTLSRSDYICELIFVAPENQIRTIKEIVSINCPNFKVLYVIENKNSSLPQAINQGLAEIRTGYWNWVGDDDRVILNEIDPIISNLSRNDRFVLGVGSCKYFSSKSKKEILNKTTKLAASIIFWGPNLIPQPSIVFRPKVVRQLGGVNPKYQLAFDQDLILNVLEVVKYSFIIPLHQNIDGVLTLLRRAVALNHYVNHREFACNTQALAIKKFLYK